MRPQRPSRKVHASAAEDVFDVQLPERLPPGVSLAVSQTRQNPFSMFDDRQSSSSVIRAAKLEVSRRQERRARATKVCKYCSGFWGGSLAFAGFIVLSVNLVDVLTLAPMAQANCVIWGFEYPGGYPTDAEENEPCPAEPACLFQVRSDLHGGKIVRNWNVPFEIPIMNSPGEKYSIDPPHASLSCCPITPGNCCSWYDANTSSWCDRSNKPNCPQGSWPCYFEKEEFYGGDADAAELDGSFMKVGEKTRSLSAVFVGMGLFAFGMLILTMWNNRCRAASWRCIQTHTAKLNLKIWIWTLKAIKRIPKWMLPENVVDWWRSETDKILLVQKCIRGWLERKRNKDQFIMAKDVAFWGNQVVQKTYEPEDMTMNARRVTTFIPTEKDQEQKKRGSDVGLTEKDQKRKKGSNNSNSTGSSDSGATTTSSEEPSRQKSGSSKESTKPAATFGQQASQDEKQIEQSKTRIPDRQVNERAEAQSQELTENRLPKATKKTRSRKLLYDSGDMHNFKRLSRVRVVSEPWQRLCVEVALEEGAPQFGAFVRVVELSYNDRPVPPVVSRVLRCSMAAENGIQQGFELLKVNRLEWPNFPAEEMVQELQSGRRPLFLMLQEPETRESRERERLVQAGYTSPPRRPSSASRPLPPGASSSAPVAPEVAPPAMPGDEGMPSSYDLEAAALGLPGEAAAPQFDIPALEIRNSNGSVRPMAQPPKRPHSAGTHASNMRIAEAARDRRRPMSAAALGMAGRDSSLGRTQTWQQRLSLDSNASSEAAAPSRPSSSYQNRRGHGGGGQQQAAQQRQFSGMSHSSGSNAGRRSRPGSAASARSNSRVGQAAKGSDESLRPASAGGSSKQPGVVGGRESDQKRQQQQKRPSSAAAALSRPPPGVVDRQQVRRKTLETSEALGSLLGF